MTTDQGESNSSSSSGGELQKSQRWGFSKFTRRAATVVGMVAFVGIGLFIASRLLTLILVLFLGILFAIFLRGPTRQLGKHTGLSETLALFIVLAVLLIVFGGATWLMAPAVTDQIELVGEIVPEAIDELRQWLEEAALGQRMLEELAELEPTQLVRGEILGPLGGALFGVAGGLGHLLFVLAVGIYLAYDPDVYKRGIVRIVPMHYRERAQEVIDVCSHQLAWWLIGRLLAMLAVAVIITIGLWIMGIPLPVFLGLIAGLLSFVPILGPLVSWVPAALIAVLEGPQYVIWTALLYLGAQGIESYFITPIVQHRVVSLPHAMTLIAEIFAGILFGLIGITVATPLAVLLMALVNMIYIEDVLGDTTPFTELAEEYH